MDFYSIIEHIENTYDIDAYSYKGHNFVAWFLGKERDILYVYDDSAPLPIREILYLIAKEYAPRKGALYVTT